jgi:enoyl reductase
VAALAAALVAALAAAALAAAAPGLASADDVGGNGTPTRTGDRTWLTQVSRTVQLSGSGYHGGSGNVGGSADFTPPPCWYEPYFDSAGAKDYLENDVLPISTGGGSIGYDFGERVKKLLQEPGNGKQPYHAGEPGVWYGVRCSLDVPLDVQAAFQTANPDFVWVGPGYPAPPGPSLDARTLAEIARAFLTVPTTPISSNPDTALGKPSTVNLPTWLWSAPAAVDVTAAIPGLASTVTARLEDIRIVSVPADATRNPGSGDCGGLGRAFDGGVGAPPCGVTFGASAAAVTVGLSAVWRLTWAATNGQGGDLGTVPFAQDLGFTVHEVQVINGHNWARSAW